MSKPRRLSDLYVLGKTVSFDDGAGDPVEVWLQKISPLDHEAALRRANQARAQVLARQEADNIDRDIASLEAEELGPQSRIEYLVLDQVAKKAPALESEIASEEPWSENGYLQGLRDAWTDELAQRYLENPEDPEALHVFSEMKKFTEAVQERIEAEKDDIRADFEGRDEQYIFDKVVEKFLQNRADTVWLAEFRRAEIWLGTRDPKNRRKRYFEERSEIDELSQEVLIRLLTEYRSLIADPIEGKDLAAPHNSSESSESPENQETENPSGLSVVSG